MADIVFEDLGIFQGSIDGSDFVLFGSGGNQVPSKPTREDFQITIDKLFDYFADRYNREQRFEVGDVWVTKSVTAPSTKFGGTWVLIDAETRLIAGTSAQVTAEGSAVTTGNNSPTVPIPLHTHGASFSGNPLPPHNHSMALGANDDAGNNPADSTNTSRTGYTNSTSAGTPSGSVTISSTGTANATLDVRGKRIYFYHWLRTA